MKPNIIVSSLDAERLEILLDALPPAEAATHDGLLDELGRAEIVAPTDVPPGVVTMNSTVRFEIDTPREQLRLTLAYPRDMAGTADAISILTPVGTALLGLSVGDAIDWPRPDGQLVKVRILEVLRQPGAGAGR
ncbi:MAG TPA: nucleoside diphosphate kinase regulator [Duganella sp.]|uniref:nucleoside diphosphate kinase regulator n=1 Tax=Duganella sp. TaxID=1904440 RepID=UPI002ED1775E